MSHPVFTFRPEMSRQELIDTAHRREEAYADGLHTLTNALAAIRNLATLAAVTGEPLDLAELGRILDGKVEAAHAATRSFDRLTKRATAFSAVAFKLPDPTPLYAEEVECPRCKAIMAKAPVGRRQTLGDLLALAAGHDCLPRVHGPAPAEPETTTHED
jgi:hypothetical protein